MKLLTGTLPLHSNYGGILQNYALCQVLSSLGHYVESIRWGKNKFTISPWKIPLVYTKRALKGIEVRKEQRMRKEFPIVAQELIRFTQQYIPQTFEHFETAEHLKDYLKSRQFEGIVYGSDQIWRKSYEQPSFIHQWFKKKTFPSPLDFYGSFVKEEKLLQISYAASFGVDYAEYNAKEREQIAQLIDKFTGISVREKSGTTLGRDVYGWKKDIQIVLDPTLLLNASDYTQLIEKSNTSTPKESIFCYILDQSQAKEEIRSIIESKTQKQSHLLSLDIYNLKKTLSERILPSIEQWLRNIKEADLIVTDSFHAVAFSIIFNKPFVALSNPRRGNTRFQSLLSMLGLENRIGCSNNDITAIIEQPIEWDCVNDILRIERKKSLKFLIKYLNS